MEMNKMPEIEYITLKSVEQEPMLYIEPANVAGKPGSLLYDSDDCMTSAPSGEQIYKVLAKVTREGNSIDAEVAEALLDIDPVLILDKIAERECLTEKTIITDRQGRQKSVDYLMVGSAAQTERGEINIRMYLRDNGMSEDSYGNYVREAKQAVADLEKKYRVSVSELGQLYGRAIELDATEFEEKYTSMMPEHNESEQDTQRNSVANIREGLKKDGVVMRVGDLDEAANF